MPREISSYAIGLVSVLKEQVLRMRKLEGLSEGEMDIGMSLGLISQFDCFRLSEDFK